MCGFFGIANHDRDISSLESNIQKAISLLSHRGPDDSGFFKNVEHARFDEVAAENQAGFS